MPKPICFVIQPMGDRSDNVCDIYFKPALGNEFDLHQPDSQPSASITAEIFQHLKEDILVIAFLGSPYRVPSEGNNWLWNPNVMLEAGYRLALGRPILFVREKRSQDGEPFLPFDLFDISTVELLNADEEKERIHREKRIKEIREYASEFSNPSPAPVVTTSIYTYPAATMAFGGARGKITAASDDAASFFHYPPETKMVGLDMGDVVKKLLSEMVPSQREAFEAEQDRLFGKIFQGQKPIATVCIVFGEAAIHPGETFDNAYLPIVTRFKATSGAPTELEVIYVDVAASALAGKDGVVRCNLGMAVPGI